MFDGEHARRQGGGGTGRARQQCDVPFVAGNFPNSREATRATPSFVVNDRPIQGALPLAEFRKVIDAALLDNRAAR